MQVEELDPTKESAGTSAPPDDSLPPSIASGKVTEIAEYDQDAGEEEQSGESPPAEPEASAPEIDIEEILSRPEVQQAIERRAANLAGNRLQQQLQQEQEWKQAEAYYQRLSDDDEFFEQQVKEHGEAKILRWIADYKAAKEERDRAPLLEPQLYQLAEQFNQAAITAFKGYVQRSPLWNQMPREWRQEIEGLSYDSTTPWIEKALKLLVDAASRGPSAKLARQAEQTRQAFQQSRQGPVPAPAGNRVAVPPQKIIEDYAYGRGPWTLEDYEWAKRQLGQDW